MRKVLELALAALLAILLVTAVAGASTALFGALAGLENVKVVGGAFAGFGALGFFVLLLSPLGQILGSLSSLVSNKSAQQHISRTAQSKVSAMSKKEEK